MSARTKKLSDADYTRLADFRYALRCFLEFSEIAAGKEGLTPQQHQALLVIRASPAGAANIGRLAERLRIRHNTAVELANRLAASGLIVREPSTEDRRAVMLKLTEEGASRLEILTHVHRNELRQLRPEIVGLFNSMELETPP
ncbi:MAG: MarR family transcriptional regulator [Verrucomicrobiota bacterium]